MGLKEIKNFFENQLGTILSPIHVLPNCKKLENSNARFWRKTGTRRQTERQRGVTIYGSESARWASDQQAQTLSSCLRTS